MKAERKELRMQMFEKEEKESFTEIMIDKFAHRSVSSMLRPLA